MGFEHARLILESGKEIPIVFNPSEYNISKNASYAQKKALGMESPFTQYISGESESLKVNLFFDTYQEPTLASPKEGGSDVRKKTKQVADLLNIDPSLHRPPIVTFRYGSLNFRGVVTDVAQNFTMFLGDGRPVRAKLDVTFQSIDKESYLPLESPDRTKCRTLEETQQLWYLAWKEYGDADKWKVIARENKIMNPLAIKPGQKLKLPAI